MKTTISIRLVEIPRVNQNGYAKIYQDSSEGHLQLLEALKRTRRYSSLLNKSNQQQ